MKRAFRFSIVFLFFFYTRRHFKRQLGRAKEFCFTVVFFEYTPPPDELPGLQSPRCVSRSGEVVPAGGGALWRPLGPLQGTPLHPAPIAHAFGAFPPVPRGPGRQLPCRWRHTSKASSCAHCVFSNNLCLQATSAFTL